MNGQNKINTVTGYKKAQTALMLRNSTHAAVNQFRTLEAKLIRVDLDMYLVSGGLPIIVDDQLIGAIGVGGGLGVNDEQCAYQALTKVLGPQPPWLRTNLPIHWAPTRQPDGVERAVQRVAAARAAAARRSNRRSVRTSTE